MTRCTWRRRGFCRPCPGPRVRRRRRYIVYVSDIAYSAHWCPTLAEKRAKRLIDDEVTRGILPEDFDDEQINVARCTEELHDAVEEHGADARFKIAPQGHAVLVRVQKRRCKR